MELPCQPSSSAFFEHLRRYQAWLAGSIVCKELHRVSGRCHSTVLLENTEFGIEPRPFGPDKGSTDSVLFGKIQRLMIIDVYGDYRSHETGLHVVGVGNPAYSPQLLGRLFENQRVSSVPHDSHGIGFVETDAPFQLDRNRLGRSGDPDEIALLPSCHLSSFSLMATRIRISETLASSCRMSAFTVVPEKSGNNGSTSLTVMVSSGSTGVTYFASTISFNARGLPVNSSSIVSRHCT